MPSLVAVQHCPEYQPQAIQTAVDACLRSLGGLGAFVRPGQRVFLKVNTLVPAPPERAISTHPEVVRAAIRAVREAGAVAVVGDNPAVARPRSALKRCGILEVAEAEGALVADMAPVARLENPAGAAFKSFEVSRAVLDADVLLNLPKVKTHAMTYMTVATKNLFGVIPGTEKARWHFRAQEPQVFARLIVDLYAAIAAHFAGRLLHLADGVLAMEGDGPGMGGRPRKLGALLASTDAVALDRVACEVAGLDASMLLTLQEAKARRVGQGELDGIDWVGAPPETWRGVRLEPAWVGKPNLFSARLMRTPWLRNRILERPLLEERACKSCRRCEEICPAQALTMAGVPAVPAFDLGRCIRCYCCAEVCPEGAIRKSRPPLIGRLMASRRA